MTDAVNAGDHEQHPGHGRKVQHHQAAGQDGQAESHRFAPAQHVGSAADEQASDYARAPHCRQQRRCSGGREAEVDPVYR